MTAVDAIVRRLIERHGPIGFDVVMETALYDPRHGFYASGGQAGRRGDFITSPEVGPLFGAVISRALDQWWRAAGEPPVFVVVEAGAGPGSLARSVLHAQPACGRALRYVLVEPSAPQRAQHTRGLPIEDASSAFASLTAPDEDGPRGDPPAGPIVVSMSHLPRLPGPCVVLANELLDNIPFGLAERTSAGWDEVKVGVESDGLVEVTVPLDPSDVAWLDGLAPAAPTGARVPIQRQAASWLTDARALAGREGRVVLFDYAAPTADLASRPGAGWMRTFRAHQRGEPPLVALGLQDITGEVAIDQLDPPPTSDRAQAEWLEAHGIDDLVAEGRRVWRDRAGVGDLEAVRARSRVTEAEALLDPGGLGGFRVLEWSR